MYIPYRRISIGFSDILPFIMLFIFLLGVCIMFSCIALTNDDKVVNENYKGKYIRVLHYSPFNTDSVYKCYYKPKIVTGTVDFVGTSKIKVVYKDKEYKFKVGTDNVDKFKRGQKVKMTETFYPSHEFLLKY